MALVNAASFVRFEKLPSYELLQKNNNKRREKREKGASARGKRYQEDEQIHFEQIEQLKEFQLTNFTIFFSHQWLAFDFPDDVKGTQLEVMKAAVKKLAEDKKIELESTWIWVDYCCIPQINSKTQTLAIHSLPSYSASLHAFVVVAPHALHEGAGVQCDSVSYQKRGWCRAEVLSHISRRGVESLFFAFSKDEVALLKDAVLIDSGSKVITNMLNVFGGNFTCCSMKHSRGNKCDKENLMRPMLAVYCDIYKRRFVDKIKPIYAAIEPMKKEMFPATINIKKADGTRVKKNLFKTLIREAGE